MVASPDTVKVYNTAPLSVIQISLVLHRETIVQRHAGPAGVN
jgi:hypothetical protein